MKYVLFLLIPLHINAQKFTGAEVSKWKQQAQKVNIIRDKWGVPHIYGKTDADAVFGLLYAQCEDDFKRVEMNYIEKLGRLAEVKGEKELYNDLLIRLLLDSAEAVADYNRSPVWLKQLLNAYADGINYYLYKNPAVKPALLNRFKPWYQLLWTDGSIGAISTAGLTSTDVKNFYAGSGGLTRTALEKPSTGSNGFAFSPSITASKKSILYINPPVTFYFRPEVHMVSDEGLNVYGAVTWGQFFIYQGFNEKCGWMDTSSDVDVADVYAENTIKTSNGYRYTYKGSDKDVSKKTINLRYVSGGKMISKNFTGLYTHHGPVMASDNGKLLSLRSNNRSLKGLMQSWQRTKAKSFAEYKTIMDLRSNTSNNTVYADAEGNIAYWHGNFIPKRNPKYNWAKAVDGSIADTDWKGIHTVEESVHLYNPVNGWLQNCNSTPFTVAGPNSPDPKKFPAYMAPDLENFRGVNAVRVLSKERSYTIDKVIAAGYDTYLSAFENTVPALIRAYDNLKSGDTVYTRLAEPISILRKWDFRTDTASIATTLAIEWGTLLLPQIARTADESEYEYTDQVRRTYWFAQNAKPNELFNPFMTVLNDLENKYGTWRVPWGKINRFQRISSDIDLKFDDKQLSYPVAFAAAAWGMLPSYSSLYFQGTKSRYGVHGNSFVCAVEFGDRVKAKSLLAGGQSSDPASKHFSDQLKMYANGEFKDVLFYKEDVLKHVEKQYHPGD